MDRQEHAFHMETMVSAFHGETKRYPSYKTLPSSSSSRSGEGSDRSERGKHLSSFFSDSYTGSEGGSHSVPWSSSGAMSYVDSFTGQAVIDHDRATPVGNQRQASSIVGLSFKIDGRGEKTNTDALEMANFLEANGKCNVGSNVMSHAKSRVGRESMITGKIQLGGSYHANADHVDEDMMKLMIAGASNGFSKGPAFSRLSKGGMELEGVEKRHPYLASSPKSLGDCSHASTGAYLQRLCPHSVGAPLPSDMQAQYIPEQDALHQYNKLDAAHGMFLTHGYTHQGSSKPFAQPHSNGAVWCVCCQSEDYTGNAPAHKNSGDPYRATFNGSMEVTHPKRTSGYVSDNMDGQNCLPSARPRGSWDAQSHSDDLYPYGIPQQPRRTWCSVTPLVPPEFMTLHDPGSGGGSHHAGLLYAPACTCCNHHACATPRSDSSQNSKHHHYAFSDSQSPWGAHQEERFQIQAQRVHKISLDEQSRRGNQDVQLHKEIGRVAQHACLTTTEEKGLPPLPRCGAAPYVLCQSCSKVLEVPKYVPYESAVQRLRCSACKKVSKFSTSAFVNNRHPSSKGNYMPTVKSQGILPLTARSMHPAEQHSPDFQKVHSALNPERAMDIDSGLEVQSSDNHNMVAQRSLPAGCAEDGKDIGPTSTAVILQGQQGGLSPNQLLDGLEWKKDLDASAAELHNPEAMVGFDSHAEVSGQEGRHALAAPVLEVGGLRQHCDERGSLFSGPQEACEKVSIVVGHNQHDKEDGVEASNTCVSSAPSSPAPGSPLYEHLSYDAASSDTGETVAKEGNGGQAGVEVVQEGSKGTKSLTGFLKRSIREFGKGGQGTNKTGNVVVNGQIIPLVAIESAEKQAGKIHPGTYWYDYHAGFWGVIGGPCLGIIPPMIEELKFPLSRDCAGGNTGIFINGRELHKKDLEVLVGRGMPRSPGKAYMVDISGHIVDQESGKVLKSLGRLAPTIQRRGRGCGMYQPTIRM